MSQSNEADPYSSELPLTMSAAMATVTRYHEYLWTFVQPWLGERVLEVGVGFGQYTRRMLSDNRSVLGCDIDSGHLEALKDSARSSLLETQRLDLEDPEPTRSVIKAFSPDTIVLLNVLEHVNSDERALAFLREVTGFGGRIVVIVPALASLYNGLDREAGHHRRYSRAALSMALSGAGWRVLETRYINLPGVVGWLAAGWLSLLSRRNTELNAPATNWLIRLYDRFFVGFSRITDPATAKFAGLSVLAVAQKT